MRNAGDYVAKAHAYADGVLDGSVPSCLTVRQACERWRADLLRADIWLDGKAANRVCRFAETLRHFKGALAGQRLRLEPWQCFVLVNVFGWKRKDTGCRRFTYADVLVPRKNGKTMIASAIGLYLLFMDGEAGAEVYAAAVDKAQARLCFDGSVQLLKGSIVQDLAKVYQAEIRYPGGAGTYKPLSKDTKNKDGLNPHGAICDERHAWQTNEIFDLIKTGIGARRQPLVFSISTAGMDTSLPYYTDIQVLRDVLAGVKEKDNHFALLYIPDEGDRYDDPLTWRKVNPNLGVSLSEAYMEAECAEAKLKGGTTLNAFCVKNLNMWTDAPDVWIADDDVMCNGNGERLRLDALEGQECYVGIDLASKADLSAVALWFPALRCVRWLYYVPEAKVAEMEDRVDYRLWAEQGWLRVGPGKVLDEEWFLSDLLRELDRYQVRCIAFDPWGMWNLKTRFGRYEDVLMEYQQGIRYMSVPTKWVEEHVLRHEFDFGGDPVIRWMFRNVVVYVDPNANIKLDKARSRNKIDGVVALVDAVGGWLNLTSGKTGEIYMGQSLRVLSF